MKRNQKLGWMGRWCSMEVNMNLKECLLCWRGCMSCLKVKNSGSITDENLHPYHSHVFYNRSKLWVFRPCSNSWSIHSCDMMLCHWIIGFWCYKTTHWSRLQESSVQEGLSGMLTLEMRLLLCLRMWETSYPMTWFLFKYWNI